MPRGSPPRSFATPRNSSRRCIAKKRTRNYRKALAALQEELGAWNDAAVAARLAGELAGPQAPAAAAFSGWAARSRGRTQRGTRRALDPVREDAAVLVTRLNAAETSACSNPPKSAIVSPRQLFTREEPKLREALLNNQFEIGRAATAARSCCWSAVSKAAAAARRRTSSTNGWIRVTSGRRVRPAHAGRGARARSRGATGAPAAARKDRHLHERVVPRARARARVRRICGNGSSTAMLHEVRQYEQMLTDEGIVLLKFWIHLSRETRRSGCRRWRPIRESRWRVTPDDPRRCGCYGKSARHLGTHAARNVDRDGAVVRRRRRGRALPHADVGKILLDAMQQVNAGAKPPPPPVVAPAPSVIGNVVLIRHLDLTQRLDDRTYERELAKYQEQARDADAAQALSRAARWCSRSRARTPPARAARSGA